MGQLKTLRRHKKVGLDVDGTLIDDDDMSQMLQDFVVQHHTEIDFYIVTHRSHGMFGDRAETVWEDLDHASFGHLKPHMFKDVFGLPPTLFEAYGNAEALRMRNRKVPADILKLEREFYLWKGLICRKHDITVLVDDNPEHNLDGCVHHGVEFILTKDL